MSDGSPPPPAQRLRQQTGWSPRIGLDEGLAAPVRLWKERT